MLKISLLAALVVCAFSGFAVEAAKVGQPLPKSPPPMKTARRIR